MSPTVTSAMRASDAVRRIQTTSESLEIAKAVLTAVRPTAPQAVAIAGTARHTGKVDGSQEPSYLLGMQLVSERVPDFEQHPFSVPCIRSLDLWFRRRVTLLVGENGSGKSTLLEGIAALCRLPLSGGGRQDLGARHGPRVDTSLADALRPRFRQQPRDAYFFRGEFSAHFASLLDQRKADPDFLGNPYANYGGKSLHTRSHGEGYITLMNERIGHDGIYLFDEPEAALSPQRQLALLAILADRLSTGTSQFIIATHSPIVMTIPGAEILQIERESIAAVKLEDTEHFQLTRAILQNPAAFWQRLREPVE